MCCEDSLVFVTCCKFIKGTQPSAGFGRERCTTSVPPLRKGCRGKEETVILLVHQQKKSVTFWRGLVANSRAEMPPGFSIRNITQTWSHLSWRLVGENPPNFAGPEEGACSRARSAVS